MRPGTRFILSALCVALCWLSACSGTQTRPGVVAPSADAAAQSTRPDAGDTDLRPDVVILPAQRDSGSLAVANVLAGSQDFGPALAACAAQDACEQFEAVTQINDAGLEGDAGEAARLLRTGEGLARAGGAAVSPERSASELSTSLGSIALSTLSADVLLQGLANFLLNRVQMELRATVLGRIRDLACPAEAPPLNVLVHTCGYLGEGAAADAFQPDFGNGLRAAMERDVVDLPSRLLAYFDQHQTPATGDLRAVLRVTNLVLRRSSPTQVIEEVRGMVSNNTDGERALQFLALVIQQVALQNNAIEPGVRDRVVYLLARSALCSTEACQTALASQRYVVHEIAARATAIVRAIEVMNDAAQPANVRRERIAVFATNLAVAMSTSIRLRVALHQDTVTSLPEGLGELVRALERVPPLFDAVSSGEPGRIVSAVLGEVRHHNGRVCEGGAHPEICRQTLRVVEMGAELASARTEQDVERILEGFALPSGAYRRQRLQRTMAISTLGGVAVGGIWQAGRPAAPQANLVLTLGLELTYPICWGDLGVHLSVLDLGAYASYSGSGSNEVEWQRFVTPGLWVRWGFKDLPVAAAIGANVSPLDEGRPVRVLAFLGFDLPIFLLGN